MFDFFEDFLLPIMICVVLPLAIVWISTRNKRHELDRKTELALKAIENGAQIDTNLFTKPNAPKSIKEKVYCRLTSGCILSALGLACILSACFGKYNDATSFYIPLGGGVLLLLGIAFIVTYIVGRKHFAAEIADEEAKIGKE